MVLERAKTLLPQRWHDSARECLDWVRRLSFRPYVQELEVEGEHAQFHIGDPTAEQWYVRHPAGAQAQLHWLQERMLSPGDVVFECGSHHGFFPVFLSRFLGEEGLFVCLEAHPRNAEIISTNLRLNQLSNVRVMNCVVGRERGWARVLNASNARFVARADGPGRGLTVPMTTLDQVVHEVGRSPTLLKLDIEGKAWRSPPWRGLWACSQPAPSFPSKFSAPPFAPVTASRPTGFSLCCRWNTTTSGCNPMRLLPPGACIRLFRWRAMIESIFTVCPSELLTLGD